MLHSLPSIVLKTLLPTVGPAILSLMNLSLSMGIVPSSLKAAVIKPLLNKPGLDPELVSNYRLVWNLPFLSKVQDRIAAKQIVEYLTLRNIAKMFICSRCRDTDSRIYIIKTGLL